MKLFLIKKTVVFALLLFSSTLSSFSQSGDICRKKGQSLQAFFTNYKSGSQPIVMAHRMSPSVGFAENSLTTLAYNLAHYPCAIQEIDVRITSDGKAVLSHDATLDRTTTGSGEVSSYTYRELQKLSLKEVTGKILTNERIPLLADALKMIKKKAIVMLDMKPGTDAEIMMRIVQSTGTFNDVIVICYSVADAQSLNKKYPDLMLALGFNSLQDIEKIRNSGLPFSNLIALVPKAIQNQDYYDRIRKMGIPISFSAQMNMDLLKDSKKAYKDIYQQGITILCTDSITNVHNAFNPE